MHNSNWPPPPPPRDYCGYIEKLEARIADLTKERDEINKRRKEAMIKIEDWRKKCWSLTGHERPRRITHLSSSGTVDDTRAIAVADDGSVWTITIGIKDNDDEWRRLPNLPQGEI